MSDEEAQSKVEVTGLLRRFLDQDVSSGEALLEMSARCDPALHIVATLLLEVLCLALVPSKTAELACGIIANLMLWEAFIDPTVRALDLPNALMDVCCSNDDPYTLSEAVRAMTNMAYKGRSHLLQPSFARIAEFAVMVVDNSLSSRLLTQVVQFVYYLQVYGAPATQEAWFSQWEAAEFFRHLLGNTEQAVVAVNVEISELLKGEKLGDCSGLEWMLLCLDHAASRSGESQLDWEHSPDLMKAILKYSLTLLLSPKANAWDECDVNATSGASLSLQLSEKFLLISIMETVCGDYSPGAGKPTMADTVNEIARNVQALIAPRQGSKGGLRSLLPVLLESCEEAVLMKDSYALSAASFLICALFAPQPEEGQPLICSEAAPSAEGPPLEKRVARIVDRDIIGSATLASVSAVVEIIHVPENNAWVKSVSSSGGEHVVQMLTLLEALTKHAGEGAAESGCAKQRTTMQSVSNSIEALLSSLR
jgi:hypothetical protein